MYSGNETKKTMLQMTAKIDISVTALPREDRGDGPVTAREFWPGDFFPTPLKGMIPSSPMRICSYAVYL